MIFLTDYESYNRYGLLQTWSRKSLTASSRSSFSCVGRWTSAAAMQSILARSRTVSVWAGPPSRRDTMPDVQLLIIIMLFHGTWYHYQTLFDQTGYSKTKYHNDSYRNKTIKKPLMHPTANMQVIIHCMTHLIRNNELQTSLVRRPWWRRNENEFLPPSISGFAWRHF